MGTQCLIHLCLCNRYEHFLNIYASRDSITQIYVVFECTLVAWYDMATKAKHQQQSYTCKHVEFVIQFSSRFIFIFISLPLLCSFHCDMHIFMSYLVLNERRVFLLLRLFFWRNCCKRSHFFWCQMESANHLTLLTAEILRSNVNVTQRKFVSVNNLRWYFLFFFFLLPFGIKKSPRTMDTMVNG